MDNKSIPYLFKCSPQKRKKAAIRLCAKKQLIMIMAGAVPLSPFWA